jgi:hypothetical protein
MIFTTVGPDMPTRDLLEFLVFLLPVPIGLTIVAAWFCIEVTEESLTIRRLLRATQSLPWSEFSGVSGLFDPRGRGPYRRGGYLHLDLRDGSLIKIDPRMLGRQGCLRLLDAVAMRRPDLDLSAMRALVLATWF